MGEVYIDLPEACGAAFAAFYIRAIEGAPALEKGADGSRFLVLGSRLLEGVADRFAVEDDAGGGLFVAGLELFDLLPGVSDGDRRERVPFAFAVGEGDAAVVTAIALIQAIAQGFKIVHGHMSDIRTGCTLILVRWKLANHAANVVNLPLELLCPHFIFRC